MPRDPLDLADFRILSSGAPRITARDAAGRPTTVQDANGINTILTYDSDIWGHTPISAIILIALRRFRFQFSSGLLARERSP